ncbi:hypothetical protein HZH66_003487 [Vespula vulgaris]|uniref:Uncharacterized protein n=1 Tax=Vespula vulgaris TaxID=7454 RepID=A0A834KIB7_VESVU|nr:hypothetical protein HZH66_003487 [Vespula vulgaris]
MEILFAEKYCGIVGGGGLRVDRGRVRGVRGGSRGGGGGGERRGVELQTPLRTINVQFKIKATVLQLPRTRAYLEGLIGIWTVKRDATPSFVVSKKLKISTLVNSKI